MKNFLNNIVKLDEEEYKVLLSSGNEKKISAKTIFISEGEKFNRLFFIISGIIRAFRIIDGNDYSFFFFTDDEVAIDYESYLTGKSTNLFFEALTDSSVIEYNKDVLESLFEKFPRLERLGRVIAEHAYLAVHERLKQFQTDDLEARYLKLIKRNPFLFQKVPLYHIASYLGVKPQSLSRIRAKISNDKS